MKKVKYFLFGLICVFSCSAVFAENEIEIESITPVYEANSGVVVTDEGNQHGVTFNDRDQSVEYKVVIKNTSNKDLIVVERNIGSKGIGTGASYEVGGLETKDVVKANSTGEITISLNSGTPFVNEWYGENFNGTLTAKFGFAEPGSSNIEPGSSNIINPNTSPDTLTIILLVCGGVITCVIVYKCRKKKIAKYIALVLALSSGITITNAKEYPTLQININVAYQSQNYMKNAYYLDASGNQVLDDNGSPMLGEYWRYTKNIRSIYIETDPTNHTDFQTTWYKDSWDVSENKNGRVMAYLAANKDNSSYYDLHLQSDGVIYANRDASYYFYGMKNLIKVEGFKYFDTSNVTNMESMFAFTAQTQDVSESPFNFSDFDTSNVENMGGMFRGYGINIEDMVLDLRNFNTSDVKNMSLMFLDMGKYSKTVNIDLSSFNTKKVEDMSSMFKNILSNSEANSGTVECNPVDGSGKNLTITLGNDFNTSSVKSMRSMFERTGCEDPLFILEKIGDFNTSSVTDMNSMFKNAITINTSITIRKAPDDYDVMFSYAALKTGSKITVNYTSETSDLVDLMINTKGTGESQVGRGEQVE